MRYRITDGLVKYFKDVFDNTVYVYNVDEAFSEFEKLKVKKGATFSKAPAIIAISRTSSVIKDTYGKPQEFQRGRLVQKGSIDVMQPMFVTALDCDSMYDITVIAYDNMVMDTLVDELIFKILSNPVFRYNSGVKSVVDATSEMINEASIRYEGNELGNLEESVTTENSRVYRSTFPVSVEGEIYITGKTTYLATNVAVDISESE